ATSRYKMPRVMMAVPGPTKAPAVLLTGYTITIAANAAEVNQSTVSGRLRDRDHPASLAPDGGRRERRQAMQKWWPARARKAADYLEGAPTQGNGKAARAWLHGPGFLSGQPR